MRLETWLILGGIGLAIALVWHAVLLWLASRLRAERAPDEIYRTHAEDGWALELARYRPERADPIRAPVILCHGIGANSVSLDLAESISLPRFLRARGFDCWLLDLRGRGGSSRPPQGRGPYDYSFDDHARFDVKAAIELVRKETGAAKVAWVGHSMGGMSLYAHCEVHGDDALAAGVVIGSPVALVKKTRLAYFARWAKLHRLPAVYQVLAARLVAPLAGFWTPPIAKLIVNPENMEPRMMRLGLAQALANFSNRAIQQLARWIVTGELRAEDGTHVWFTKLDRITAPWFAIAGELDKLVPPPNVEAALAKISSREKRWLLAGPSSGLHAPYGHIDLCLGPRCREEIFPRVAEFLEAHAVWREAPSVAAGLRQRN